MRRPDLTSRDGATIDPPCYWIGCDELGGDGQDAFAAVRTRGFPTIQSFFAAAHRLIPGRVVVDLDGLGSDLERALRRLRTSRAVTGFVVQVRPDGVEEGAAAMRLGAADLLVKPYDAARFARALSRLDEPAAAPRSLHDSLSGREREVLNGLARGRTNKQIAAELGISHRTVEIHRLRLRRKLGARALPTLLDILSNAHEAASASGR